MTRPVRSPHEFNLESVASIGIELKRCFTEYNHGFGKFFMYLISGMHRSGTSLVTRFCYEAGADLGDANTFYQPDRWNPDGYFEQPEFHAINMPLINGPWGKLAYFHLPSTNTIMKRASRLSDQIANTAEKYRNKVVKETRFCLTLPAWRAHGASIDGLAICLRHPADVARSLRRRNRIPRSIAYRLWQTHLERLLEHSKDIPRRFVKYENVLDHELVAGELRGVIADAGVACDDDGIGKLQRELVRLKPGLLSRKPPRLPASVGQYWDDLLQRHASQGS